ncbi:hypothetical protein PG994_006580 [Apiospora phragmitis]|uniref:Uncharacterized protein n=1 Tax=Apiospora phragmitis TaxID=2905665 RepID=A0ABR1VJ23_9PEZI
MPCHTDIATRALVITLKSPLCGKTNGEIEAATGVKKCTIKTIYARAIKARFDPNARPFVIRNEWLADKPRSGRPRTRGRKLDHVVPSDLQNGSEAESAGSSGLLPPSEEHGSDFHPN